MKTLITICSLLTMGLVATSCSSPERKEETVTVTNVDPIEKREVKRSTSADTTTYDNEATSSGRGR